MYNFILNLVGPIIRRSLGIALADFLFQIFVCRIIVDSTIYYAGSLLKTMFIAEITLNQLE